MSHERKKLVWSIKKGLFHLSVDELFQLATDITPTPDQPCMPLHQHDDKSVMEYLCSYMDNVALLELEDEGMSQLLLLKDKVDERVNSYSQSMGHTRGSGDFTVSDVIVSPVTSEVAHMNTQGTSIRTTTKDLAAQTEDLETQISKLLAVYNELKLKQSSAPPTTQMGVNLPTARDTLQPHSNTSHTTYSTESMIALKDLTLLERKEFKIHGEQISDTSSEISYNNIIRQIDEGLRENHTGGEMIRAVLCVIKPGNFKEMLTSKEDMTICELKSFLQ